MSDFGFGLSNRFALTWPYGGDGVLGFHGGLSAKYFGVAIWFLVIQLCEDLSNETNRLLRLLRKSYLDIDG